METTIAQPVFTGTPEIHHLALQVHDLHRAEDFYCRRLGLQVIRRWDDEMGAHRSTWLKLHGDGILMLERHRDIEPTSANTGSWSILVFRIRPDQRQQVRERLEALDIHVEGQTDHTLYVRDPEGNRVGFSHWPAPTS